MWYFLGNQSRIVLSKICPKDQKFSHFGCRNFRHVRQTNKPKVNQPMIRDLNHGTPQWTDLIKPTFFTVGFGTTVMTGAFIWKYENVKRKEEKLFDPLLKYFQNLPPAPKAGEWRQKLNKFWNQFIQTYMPHDGQKVAAGIFSINMAVFLLWRFPFLQTFMMKYFASNPAAKQNCLPMLLSAFSHIGPMHLAFNMIALSSFVPTLVDIMGKEHFLGVYLTGAVISSYSSYLFRVISKTPGVSVGASGALFTILGIYGTLMPDSQWSIIFLPMVSFSAENGIYGLMAFDIIGLITRVGFLDHAAHLGGMLFGIWWIKEGYKFVKPAVKLWDEEIRDQVISKR